MQQQTHPMSRMDEDTRRALSVPLVQPRYCGTGETGYRQRVKVYGYCHDEQNTVALYVAGLATSVKQTIGTFNSNRIQNAMLLDTGSATDGRITLRREPESKYTSVLNRIKEVDLTTGFLVNSCVFAPKINATSVYVLGQNPDDIIMQAGRHITAAVDVAVLPAWYIYLWKEGRIQAAITKLNGEGINGWKIRVTPETWRVIIKKGLQNRYIQF